MKQYMNNSSATTTEQLPATLRQQSIASYRSVEEYRLWKEAFLQSAGLREWIEKNSRDCCIVGSRFAVHVGNISWENVERFFDLIEWGEFPPHYYAEGIRDYVVQHGGVRIWWTDSFEKIDAPGMFVLIPTSSANNIASGEKLQAYRNQCAQPLRFRLKPPHDIQAICKHFEEFAKPVVSYQESEAEWEFRLLQAFVKIVDYARAQVATINNSAMQST